MKLTRNFDSSTSITFGQTSPKIAGSILLSSIQSMLHSDQRRQTNLKRLKQLYNIFSEKGVAKFYQNTEMMKNRKARF